MTDQFRALCANLTAALNDWQCETGDDRYEGLLDRARALLAQEAVGPSEKELYDLFCEHAREPVESMRAALARWGRPAAAPVPGPTDEALANFTAWFCRNYPGPDTLIHRPEWHAPKVFRAASDAIGRWGRQPARLRNCPTHGQQPPEAWGCPDCVRELREELAASLHPTPAVEGEVAELVKWLRRRAAEVQAENCTTIYSPHLRRVADLLAQTEPEGSASMDYARQCNTQAVAALLALEALADAVDQFGLAGGADGKALAAEVEKARGILARLSLAHPASVPLIELPQGWHMLSDIEPEPGAMCEWVIMAPWGCDHGSGQWPDYCEFLDVPVGWSVRYKGFANADGVMVSDPELTAWRMLPLPTMAAEARL